MWNVLQTTVSSFAYVAFVDPIITVIAELQSEKLRNNRLYIILYNIIIY